MAVEVKPYTFLTLGLDEWYGINTPVIKCPMGSWIGVKCFCSGPTYGLL